MTSKSTETEAAPVRAGSTEDWQQRLDEAQESARSRLVEIDGLRAVAIAIQQRNAELLAALKSIVQHAKPCLDSPLVGWSDVPEEDLHAARSAIAAAERGDK